MKRSKKRAAGPAQRLCAELHSDDGIDPRHAARRAQRDSSAPDRKTWQLCKQVHRAIEFALAAECGDPILKDLVVTRVEPAPGAGTLAVTVRPSVSGDAPAPRDAIERRLAAARGRIRAVVATEITRRKTPELRFQVLGVEEAAP